MHVYIFIHGYTVISKHVYHWLQRFIHECSYILDISYSTSVYTCTATKYTVIVVYHRNTINLKHISHYEFGHCVGRDTRLTAIVCVPPLPLADWSRQFKPFVDDYFWQSFGHTIRLTPNRVCQIPGNGLGSPQNDTVTMSLVYLTPPTIQTGVATRTFRWSSKVSGTKARGFFCERFCFHTLAAK